MLQFNINSFLNNFSVNIAILLAPLVISIVILLYKVRNKHLAAKSDLAQQLYEVIMG